MDDYDNLVYLALRAQNAAIGDTICRTANNRGTFLGRLQEMREETQKMIEQMEAM